MFIGTGIISDKQFFKHFGNDIFIWPFDPANLKGSTYNLTASIVAFYEENGENISVVNDDDKIILPKRRTIFIQTEESIYVNKKICGTYHTKVKMVSKGISSISTTLDPCYFGTSLVAVTNQNDYDVEIDVGDTFCSLMLYKMRSASNSRHDNPPFRSDIHSNKINKFKFFEKNTCGSCGDFKTCSYKLRYNDKSLDLIKQRYKEWYGENYRVNKNDLIALVRKFKKEVLCAKSTNLKISAAIGLNIILFMSLVFTYIIKPNLIDGKLNSISSDTIFSYFILPMSIYIYSWLYNYFKI